MYPTKNVTFRCYEIDADAISRAAERAGKTLSDYCRDVMIGWAWSDVGERRPSLPPLERGRYANMVEQAAKARGVSREQFAREAAEAAAAAALGLAGPHESGERPAVLQPQRVRRVSDVVPAPVNGRYSQAGGAGGVKRR